MKHSLIYLAVMSFLVSPALAADAKVGTIEVDVPFARASPAIANAGAGFMVLRNNGKEADRLKSAKAEISKKVELHNVVREGEMSKMTPVEHIDLPAGSVVELKPGSYHVMFLGLHQPLAEGGNFPLTLHFEKAGPVTVNVPIKGMGAMPTASGHK
jgi:copper(I)-binding protein